MVTSGGTISTVAGNGNASYSGDLQTATGAQFNDPSDVAVDAAGNLYIADSVNNVIRAVNTQSGTITVLGITIPPGDTATVAGNESLHSTCTSATIFCFGGDGGPATSALLNLPEGKWRWMEPAISISPTLGTLASARWPPAELFRLWPGAI